MTAARAIAVAGVVAGAACASGGAGPVARPLPAGVEAVSLFGDTLRALPLPAETRARYEQQLAVSRASYERAPRNADSAVWYGRRLAYLGRFREAIDVYTRGIALHARDPWLYRHRGHRYISVRDFDRAIVDLETAARLTDGMQDVPEPDGQPNAMNVPIGTLFSNVAYHLGLAYYLKGDFTHAAAVFGAEVAAARNEDRFVSALNWQYMSLRRLGRDVEAEEAIVPVQRQMRVIENGTYHRLLLLYKGALPVDSLLPNGETMSVTDATAAYGVGNWHLVNGRRAEAEQVFRRILAGGQWGAFGYIAAEAELARMRAPASR